MVSGRSWSYIIGAYLGDGCVYSHNGYLVFVLSVTDKDFVEAAKLALEGLTDYAVSICPFQDKRTANAKRTYRLRCGDARLCDVLRNETNNKLSIPDWLFAAPAEDRLAFIAGLMDSEGYVCIKDSRRGATLGFKSTDAWFEDFLRLLRSVGITHGKVGVEQPRRPGYRTPRRVSIKLQSWIDSGGYFRIARKQAGVERWAKMPRYGRVVTT